MPVQGSAGNSVPHPSAWRPKWAGSVPRGAWLVVMGRGEGVWGVRYWPLEASAHIGLATAYSRGEADALPPVPAEWGTGVTDSRSEYTESLIGSYVSRHLNERRKEPCGHGEGTSGGGDSTYKDPSALNTGLCIEYVMRLCLLNEFLNSRPLCIHEIFLF